jgi:hypothetical protein
VCACVCVRLGVGEGVGVGVQCAGVGMDVDMGAGAGAGAVQQVHIHIHAQGKAVLLTCGGIHVRHSRFQCTVYVCKPNVCPQSSNTYPFVLNVFVCVRVCVCVSMLSAQS